LKLKDTGSLDSAPSKEGSCAVGLLPNLAYRFPEFTPGEKGRLGRRRSKGEAFVTRAL